MFEALERDASPKDPVQRAHTLAALGRPDEAVASLEEAYRVREGRLVMAGVDPPLRTLRGEPRFEELLRRLGVAS